MKSQKGVGMLLFLLNNGRGNLSTTSASPSLCKQSLVLSNGTSGYSHLLRQLVIGHIFGIFGKDGSKQVKVSISLPTLAIIVADTAANEVIGIAAVIGNSKCPTFACH